MLAIIMLQPRVVGVVGLDAAGSRIRMARSEALGHVWAMNQGTRGDNSGIFTIPLYLIPLYLSVALGLSAIETGVRILPLSLTLLVAAAGIPRFLPNVSPRRVVRLGLLAMLVASSPCSAASTPPPGPRS